MSDPGAMLPQDSEIFAADDEVFLRPQIKLEPLCCRWYAWSHLISPVQHALNVAYRQLPLLQSFLASPRVHEAALQDPSLLGGAFVHLKASDAAAVRLLMQDMRRRCARLIQFAHELLAFDRELQEAARSAEVDTLYERLPPALLGIVELTCDLNDYSNLRVLEELLYEDGLGQVATQELGFFRGPDEQRKFFLNTPRLDGPAQFVLPLPFAHQALDLIARSRRKPVRVRELTEALPLEPDVRASLLSQFTCAAPAARRCDPPLRDVRLRYFGHACVLVQSARTSILIDPLFTWDAHGPAQRLTFDDLPARIDYVFLTHNHHDHFSPEVFLQLRHRIGRILVLRNNPNSRADPSMRHVLHSLGFSDVQVMDAMDCVSLEDGFIASVPFLGEHAALDIASKHAMYLCIRGHRLVFVADSNCLQCFGRPQTLFIGMECEGAPLGWIYGPYMSRPLGRKQLEARRTNGSDAQRAWSALEQLGASQVFVYAMG